MPGLVVRSAPHTGRRPSEELRLPKRSATAAGKLLEPGPRGRDPDNIRAPALERLRGRLLWRRAATTTWPDSTQEDRSWD
ncbi:hypothetical protein MG293_009566 [Ovis ammon polii]|uniref:Uncharacterized protein n=1 Tax=Ovis ammon polii TaxID=230172 RepID=A0AAD4UAC5_OVIAM|nr:hypothetical protein MG293_009566 [Ovis ammon polii]KAI4568195.1 hypothetical protein MJT46_007993 [Ovis ammon polii x Ovis aries]